MGSFFKRLKEKFADSAEGKTIFQIFFQKTNKRDFDLFEDGTEANKIFMHLFPFKEGFFKEIFSKSKSARDQKLFNLGYSLGLFYNFNSVIPIYLTLKKEKLADEKIDFLFQNIPENRKNIDLFGNIFDSLEGFLFVFNPIKFSNAKSTIVNLQKKIYKEFSIDELRLFAEKYQPSYEWKKIFKTPKIQDIEKFDQKIQDKYNEEKDLLLKEKRERYLFKLFRIFIVGAVIFGLCYTILFYFEQYIRIISYTTRLPSNEIEYNKITYENLKQLTQTNLLIFLKENPSLIVGCACFFAFFASLFYLFKINFIDESFFNKELKDGKSRLQKIIIISTCFSFISLLVIFVFFGNKLNFILRSIHTKALKLLYPSMFLHDYNHFNVLKEKIEFTQKFKEFYLPRIYKIFFISILVAIVLFFSISTYLYLKKNLTNEEAEEIKFGVIMDWFFSQNKDNDEKRDEAASIKFTLNNNEVFQNPVDLLKHLLKKNLPENNLENSSQNFVLVAGPVGRGFI
jgi:hypothetical protein